MNLKTITESQRLQMEQEMAQASLDTPQVGIFWYSPKINDLFGVYTEDASVVKAAKLTTLSKRHDQIWKKEHFRAVSKGDINSPFYSNANVYDIPRGRVFVYGDSYEVLIGKWIEDYPQVKDLILNEFNLPPDKTVFKYDSHWDLGHGWSGDHMR